MATSTLTPNSPQNDSSVVDIKTYNETYRVYVKAKEDGKIDPDSIKITTSGKENSAWNKLDADATYTKMLEQTVKLYEAGSLDGIAQLIEDKEEAVNIFNRGIAQKTGQKLKALFSELTKDETSIVFDPTTDAYDSLELINEATRRRNLSPVDKAKKSIRDAVKAMFPALEGDALESQVNAFFSSLQQ